MELQVGDSVRWTSLAGTKVGTVKNIRIAPAADTKLHAWITIEYNITKDGSMKSSVDMEASDGNLKMMKVQKVGKTKTKVVKNLMTGENIEIAEDTPWCCNPSSETFWSM